MMTPPFANQIKERASGKRMREGHAKGAKERG